MWCASLLHERNEVRDQLAGWFPKISSLMDTAKVELLACTAFPRAHWAQVWSTNPLVRVHKEIKRRALGQLDGPDTVERVAGCGQQVSAALTWAICCRHGASGALGRAGP